MAQVRPSDSVIYELEKMLGMRIYDYRDDYMTNSVECLTDRGTVYRIDSRTLREIQYKVSMREARNNVQTANSLASQAQYQMQYQYGGMVYGWDYGMVNPTAYGSQTPPNKCNICKEYHIESKLDSHGFCVNRAKKFWSNVRSLYWHRYLQSKQQA